MALTKAPPTAVPNAFTASAATTASAASTAAAVTITASIAAVTTDDTASIVTATFFF